MTQEIKEKKKTTRTKPVLKSKEVEQVNATLEQVSNTIDVANVEVTSVQTKVQLKTKEDQMFSEISAEIEREKKVRKA